MSPGDRLRRSKRERIVAGVCGGLAEFYDVDVTLVRLGWVVFGFVTAGTAVLGYIVLAIIMPLEEPSGTQTGAAAGDAPPDEPRPRKPVKSSRKRRGDVLAIGLIGIGVVALVVSQGWFPLNWGVILPGLLIVVGITMVLRRPRSR
jgi:phage shock protein PspC (stress-responsive transcriptional regulator)